MHEPLYSRYPHHKRNAGIAGRKHFFVGMAAGLLEVIYALIMLEVLLRKQLRKKMTGPKGPWEEMGNE